MIFKTILTLSLIASSVRAADLDDAIQRYRQRQSDATPGSVLEWLRAGNRRFAAGASDHGGYPTDARERIAVAARGQRPLAVVLSCIDSRTTPELAFDVAPGDLFTARVGANVINDDVLGSLEIAAASGAKVIVILGHTDCGGVKGAIGGIDLGHVTAMLAKVKPALAALNARLDADPDWSAVIGDRTAQNPRYVAAGARANMCASVARALEQSPVLEEMVDGGEVILTGALFDVETGQVQFEAVR
jgi:carbonic anhydrase